MKILSINDYNALVGGTEIGTLELCKELRKKHHSVAYVGSGPGSYTWNTYSVPLIKGTENIHKNRIVDKIRIGAKWAFNKNAYDMTLKAIEKEKPDLAHLHNMFYQLSISPIVALKKKKVPMIMTVHDHRIYCPRGTLFHKKGYICNRTVGLGCAGCIGLGKAIYATLQFNRVKKELKDITLISPSVYIANKLLDLGFNRVRYLHYGVKSSKIKYSKPKGNSICYVGRLTKSKGLYVLINAMKKLKGTDIKLNIVGTGHEENDLVNLVKSRGLKNIKFLGKLSHKDTLKVMKDSLFVVIPSIWVENTPQVVFEAMSLGRCIIASDVGGLPDLVKNYKNGLLVDLGDSEKLKDKILELYCNNAKLNFLSKNAFDYAKKEFDYNNYVTHILHYYKRI